MTGTHKQHHVGRGAGRGRQPRRAIKIKALLSLGLFAGFGAVSTLAAWTSEATATATMSAGTVALGIGAPGASSAATYALPITGTNWYPGLSRAGAIAVKNTGSLDVPYLLSGAFAASELGTAMAVRVTDGTVTNGATCVGGTVVLTKAAGANFGTAAPTQLAAGASQNLCVEYSLPTNAVNTLQGKSATITLTFTATVGIP